MKQTYIQRRVLNIDKINQYRNFFTGLRNEVDVLITETGHRVLGEPIPKSVKDVEGFGQLRFSNGGTPE